ncbi:TetR family transcriptional regulator [Catenuloplanes indicus]|uniref:AcrR family transcriptional regulator n=1 Tax=Catenuloplanes indicus TaxID=137267 RepID=A0AAE4AVI8_9ACTN|nr:TetR family transcriptional regulator [Catenuloplanes indicus]MDQ0364052.1 AcrR family transcriptional regulator [Catenuloplanes indicus]
MNTPKMELSRLKGLYIFVELSTTSGLWLDTGMASLRERTKAAMRAEVTEVAFRLFAAQGFENTTVEQIAAEAGLSRTTFFRYFGTKEEVVLGRFADYGHLVADALAARPAGEPAWTALRRSFDVITAPHAAETSLDVMQLLSDACALMTRRWEKTHGWQSQLVPLIAGRLEPDGLPAPGLRARALVASAISCLDAATDAWTAEAGRTPLATLLDQAMGALGDHRTA